MLIDLIHESFNKVAVEIPRSMPAVTYWEITVTKLTNSRNLPHDSTPERSFTTAKSGKPYLFPLRFQAGCTYRVKLRGFHDAGCTCKVKAKPKSPGCTCKINRSKERNENAELIFEGQAIFRAGIVVFV